MWYATYLGIKGKVGDRARLKRELDRLSSLGITNLRILVGAEAGSDSVTSVRPYLQPSLGVLNDTVLDGLDYLLHEMERRGMKSVIYLCNSWDWSGGYGFYLKQTGHGDSPYAGGKRLFSVYTLCRSLRHRYHSTTILLRLPAASSDPHQSLHPASLQHLVGHHGMADMQRTPPFRRSDKARIPYVDNPLRPAHQIA